MSRRTRERELERALHDLPVADEEAVEERAWAVIRAAHAERVPRRPARAARRAAAVAAIGALGLGIGLSPAGAKVGELVSDVVGIGEEDARPALRSLPAAGELLVESEQGVWVVAENGSKRLLGEFASAGWSPNGRYVAAGSERELVALDPDGDVRFSVPAPGPVLDPAWGGTELDTRIAFRSDGGLWVAAGDGSRSWPIDRKVAPVAPAWLPIPELGKLGAPVPVHRLAYLDADGRTRVVDADTGARIGAAAKAPAAHALTSDWVRSPTGSGAASVEPAAGGSRLLLKAAGRREVLFSGRGRLTPPVWSPDGRWLLVGVPQADQWLFVATGNPGRLIAIDRISHQFDPGGDGEGRFPRTAGWIVPSR